MGTALLQEEGQWTLKGVLFVKSSVMMSIVGEEEECIAERVLGMFCVGCIGIYRGSR